MADANSDQDQRFARSSIYDEIGVARNIYGRGATTTDGGTLVHPAVLEAKAEAACSPVVLDELNQHRSGNRP